MLHYYM